ncbi:MAG TPA: hypothetical protein VGK02_04135 [Candidatus Aquicultor sp.]|jgi:hypothetical protein
MGKTISSRYHETATAFIGSMILILSLFFGVLLNTIINLNDMWPNSVLWLKLINPSTITIVSAALGSLLDGLFIGRNVRRRAATYGFLSVLFVIIIEVAINTPQEMFIATSYTHDWHSLHIALFEKTHGFYTAQISWFLELICMQIGVYAGGRLKDKV